VIAFEGEFAMTEGHAQELKTQALALKVGKRLRIMVSDNNAGIDDSLIGGVIDAKYDGYRIWSSSGPPMAGTSSPSTTGTTMTQVVAALKAMEEWDPTDRRPMVMIGKTIKGWWPVRLIPKPIIGYYPAIPTASR
jgi:hypothetical protein